VTADAIIDVLFSRGDEPVLQRTAVPRKRSVQAPLQVDFIDIDHDPITSSDRHATYVTQVT